MDLKSVLDLVRTVVAAMAEKVRAAEEQARNPFLNRTNVYRCEDGRPICYCCLRVGHVAKYCWDRRYSCPHVSGVNSPPQATSFPGAPVDIQSLGRDVDTLLEDLHGIVHELEETRKPIRTVATETPESIPDEEPIESIRTELLAFTPDGLRKSSSFYSVTEPPAADIYHAMNTVSGILDFRDLT